MPSNWLVVGDRQRRAAGARDAIDRLVEFGGRRFARQARLRQDRVDRALAQHAAGQIDAGNAGLRGERHDRALRRIRRRDVVAVPGERDDRASLGGLVGEARQQHRLRQLLFRHAGDRDELVGHAVAESDRPRLVEQQRIDVARRLDGAAGRGDDVEADETVHAGDADRREQAADRRRDQADEQRDQHRHRKHRSGIAGERPERDADDEEDQRQAGQQDRQRQFVRRLLPLGALDERDHAVDERRARGRGDAHLDLVGKHRGAARHRRAVAARLANDGRGFARDRGFVDRGETLDDVAVAGNDVAGLDEDDVADAQVERVHLLIDRRRGSCGRRSAWPACRCGSCAASPPAPCRAPPPPLRRSWRTAP